MDELNSGTVRLIAPNGQTVSVAESKKAERLAAGYRLPRKRGPAPQQAPAADVPAVSAGE